MTSIWRHVAEAFPPARQGTILNSHRVISIAANTSMVLNCTLVTGCSLTSYPGRKSGGANSNNKPGKPPYITKSGGLKPGFFGGAGFIASPPVKFPGG